MGMDFTDALQCLAHLTGKFADRHHALTPHCIQFNLQLWYDEDLHRKKRDGRQPQHPILGE